MQFDTFMLIVSAGVLASHPTEEESRQILDDLLRTMYRAFDFRAEEDVYDRLAVSVGGDLLADLYLVNRRSLAVAKAGGAQARVQQVELGETEVEPLSDPPLGMRFHATWVAAGSVNHWGHVHRRVNRYEAKLTVAPVEGVWKITELDVLDEERL